jgi:hypothetical protein
MINDKGRVVDWIYEFSDQAREEWINSKDDVESIHPHSENPHVDYPHVDEQPQSNINKSNKKYIDSDCCEQTNNVNLSISEVEKEIKDNIQYERLCAEYGENIIFPITNVILETVTSSKKMLKVNKKKVPKREVQAKLALLRYEHICQLIKNIQKANPNPKYFNAYMLTSLYNLIDKASYQSSPLNKFFESIKQSVNEISEHSYNLDLLMDYALHNTPKIRTC